MKDRAVTGRAIFALAAVLTSLATVAWRQSTARETMEALDRLARELAVAADQREELARRLVVIEGRPWISTEAARRLGLRPATEREVVIPSGGSW